MDCPPKQFSDTEVKSCSCYRSHSCPGYCSCSRYWSWSNIARAHAIAHAIVIVSFVLAPAIALSQDHVITPIRALLVTSNALAHAIVLACALPRVPAFSLVLFFWLLGCIFFLGTGCCVFWLWCLFVLSLYLVLGFDLDVERRKKVKRSGFTLTGECTVVWNKQE